MYCTIFRLSIILKNALRTPSDGVNIECESQKNRLRRAELNIAMFQVVLRNESNQSSQCFFRAFSSLSYVAPQGRSKTLHKFKLLNNFL